MRPPSPVFDSFPVTFRPRDQEESRSPPGLYADDNSSDSDNQMENLAGTMDDNPFRGGRRTDAFGQRVGHMSMDSTAMDSILDSATDTSSIFSEADPGATFGNMTRLENPYSLAPAPRFLPPVTMVTAPSVYETELSYVAGRSNLVNTNASNRRVSSGSRVTFNDLDDNDDEFVDAVGPASAYASTMGGTRSNESFNTARDGAGSSFDQEYDDESSVSSGGDNSVRGLVLQRRADTIPRR